MLNQFWTSQGRFRAFYKSSQPYLTNKFVILKEQLKFDKVKRIKFFWSHHRPEHIVFHKCNMLTRSNPLHWVFFQPKKRIIQNKAICINKLLCYIVFKVDLPKVNFEFRDDQLKLNHKFTSHTVDHLHHQPIYRQL